MATIAWALPRRNESRTIKRVREPKLANQPSVQVSAQATRQNSAGQKGQLGRRRGKRGVFTRQALCLAPARADSHAGRNHSSRLPLRAELGLPIDAKSPASPVRARKFIRSAIMPNLILSSNSRDTNPMRPAQ